MKKKKKKTREGFKGFGGKVNVNVNADLIADLIDE